VLTDEGRCAHAPPLMPQAKLIARAASRIAVDEGRQGFRLKFIVKNAKTHT
jgi:hypothetical protein